MPEVHVIFPPQGPAIVSHETQACVRERFVIWHIRSENPKIKHVLLEFKNPKDEFFSGSHRILAEMNPYTKPRSRSPRRSHQMVWGQAPNLPRRLLRRRSKYTVFGKGSDGKTDVVSRLDPMILITKDN